MSTEKDVRTKEILHPFAPIADKCSRALILGSFPSVKSRENAFYYGHPQNRFWRLLATLFSARVPETIEEKTALLHNWRIALWDVVSACDIIGSADSALTAHRFNDIAGCLHGTEIKRIFANGQKAGKLYRSHVEDMTGIPIEILPSTSPANAAWSMERLIIDWTPLREAVSGGTRIPEDL